MKTPRFPCADCGETLEANFTIGVAGKRAVGEGFVSGCKTQSQPFRCRYCNAMLRLNLAIQITSVEKSEEPVPAKTGPRFTLEQHSLLTRWETTGLLAVWREAVAAAFKDGQPHSNKFLFKFLFEAAPTWPKREIIRAASGTNDASCVKCWEFAGITALVINGYLRSFVGSKLLAGRVGFSLENIAGAVSREDADRRRYLEQRWRNEEGWIKTRFGYVVGQGELFEEIRRHLYARNANIWPLERPEESNAQAY